MRNWSNVKRIICIMLTVVLVLGMCATSFASDVPKSTHVRIEQSNETDVTVPSNEDDLTVELSEAIVEPDYSVSDDDPAGTVAQTVNVSGDIIDSTKIIPDNKIDGARVSLYITEDVENKHAFSDSSGSFTISDVGTNQSYLLGASADGYQKNTPRRIQVNEENVTNQVIRMEPVIVSGRLIPAVPDKVVKLLPTNETTKTDAAGNFQFKVVSDGNYTLTVDAFDNYEKCEKAITVANKKSVTEDLYLTSTSISGSVSDILATGDERWLAHLDSMNFVNVTLKDNSGDVIGDPVHTDAAGRFIFAESTDHTITLRTDYTIEVECNGYRTKKNIPVRVEDKSVVVEEQRLHPITIKGTADLKHPDIGDSINNGGVARLYRRNTDGSYDKLTEGQTDSSLVQYYFDNLSNGQFVFYSTPAKRIVDNQYAVKLYLDKYRTAVEKDIVINKALRESGTDIVCPSKSLETLRLQGHLKYIDYDGTEQGTQKTGLFGATTVKIRKPDGTIAEIKTDENGKFDSFDKADNPANPNKEYWPNGQYKVTFEVNKFERLTRSYAIYFEEEHIVLKELVLQPTRIYGRVRDMYVSGGIGGATMTLYRTDRANTTDSKAHEMPDALSSSTNARSIARNPVTTDSKGNFEFTHIPNMPNTDAPFNDHPSDSYTVVAYASHDYRENTVNNVLINYDSWYTSEIKMIPISEGYRVEGYVVDSLNRRAGNAAVRLYSRDENNELEFLQETSTDSKGDFMLEKVQPGTYKLKICYRGHKLAYYDIEVKDEDLAAGRFQLTAKHTVDFSGVIRDANDGYKPVSGVKVNIYDKDRNIIANEVTTDAAGRYSFHFANPGYTLYMGAPYTIETIYHTIPGEFKFFPISELDFDYKGYDEDELHFNMHSLEALYRISGRLLESGGAVPKPLANATVRLDNYYLGTTSIVKTDSKGEYHFFNVPPGLYTIFASKDGYTNGEERCDTVQIVDKDAFIIDSIVRPNVKKYAVSGTVGTTEQFLNPSLQRGVRVELWNGTNSYLVASVNTNSYGSYTFPLVESGDYYVKVPEKNYGGVTVINGDSNPPKITVTDQPTTVPNIGIELRNNSSVTSISLEEESMAVALHQTKPVIAHVHPSNAGIQRLNYTIRDTKIATVSSAGVVRGVSIGETEITVSATDGSGAEATGTIRVVKPATGIKINRESMNMFVGSNIPLKATLAGNPTENEVVWESDNTRRAQIDSKGYVKGISRGRALITATSKDGYAVATCIVTVKQPVKEIYLTRRSNTVNTNSLIRVHAAARPTNANNRNLSFVSRNPRVATVDKNGRVKGISPGRAMIVVSATDGSNVKRAFYADVRVGVRNIAFSQSDYWLMRGQRRYLNYVAYTTGGRAKIQWKSNNPKVVTVDSDGKVIARGHGQAIITAYSREQNRTVFDTMRIHVGNSHRPAQLIEIYNAPTTMRLREARWLSVGIAPADATDAKVTWHSSNRRIVDVNADGKLNAKGRGSATITARAGGQSTSITIQVK